VAFRPWHSPFGPIAAVSTGLKRVRAISGAGRKLLFEFVEPLNAIEGIADAAFSGLALPAGVRRCTAYWRSGPQPDSR
jgi:hypothetical protein